MQAVIGVPVHAQHLHMPNDGIDGRQKTFAIEAIGVQLLRWLVGGGDDYHAVLEEHLEQPTEDDRVADVADEQLVEAQHANFLRKPFRQRLQRISRAIELVQPNMYPAHEVVKVLAARRHGNAGVEDVHQPGLTTADRAPQVDPGRRAVSATQRLVAGFEQLRGALLRGIRYESTLRKGLLVALQR